MHGRSDHYVPQFILRRFRPQGRGRLFYAEKHAREFTTRGVRRTFCELDGDLLLKGPPAIRQKGDRAWPGLPNTPRGSASTSVSSSTAGRPRSSAWSKRSSGSIAITHAKASSPGSTVPRPGTPIGARRARTTACVK